MARFGNRKPTKEFLDDSVSVVEISHKQKKAQKNFPALSEYVVLKP